MKGHASIESVSFFYLYKEYLNPFILTSYTGKDILTETYSKGW